MEETRCWLKYHGAGSQTQGCIVLASYWEASANLSFSSLKCLPFQISSIRSLIRCKLSNQRSLGGLRITTYDVLSVAGLPLATEQAKLSSALERYRFHRTQLILIVAAGKRNHMLLQVHYKQLQSSCKLKILLEKRDPGVKGSEHY